MNNSHAVSRVINNANEHDGLWLDKDAAYWLQRLMQEVGELASVLANDHDDTMEHELTQIGGIVINWLRRLEDPDDKQPFGEQEAHHALTGE